MLYEVITSDLRACFTLGETRTFEQDVRFGVIVLAEIAQRALSPAVNDPGTAIFVLDRITRLIAGPDGQRSEDPPACPHVMMAPITGRDLVRDGFDGIASYNFVSCMLYEVITPSRYTCGMNF